jgi:tetratricopeptide (TPR) repeat protein
MTYSFLLNEEELLRLGAHAHSANLKIIAEKLFQSVLEINANSADALNGLSVLYFDQGNTSQSLSLIKTALALDPSNVVYQENQKEFQSTVTNPNHVNDLSEVITPAHEILSVFREGQFTKIVSMEKNILQHTKCQTVACVIAQSFMYLDDNINAARIIEEFQIGKSNSSVSVATFSKMLVAEKKYSAALKVLKQKIQMKSHDVALLSTKAYALYMTASYSECEKVVGSLIKFAPHNPEVHLMRGLLAAHNNKLNEALKHIEKSYNIWPEYRNVWKVLSRLYFTNGNYKKCSELTLKLAEHYPNVDRYHYSNGLVSQKLKLLNQAIKSYQKTISLSPNHTQALTNLGVIFDNLKETDNAIECFKRAVNINPDSRIACFNLYRILINKKFEKTFNNMDQALLSVIRSNVARPKQIAKAIISLIKLNKEFQLVMRYEKEGDLKNNFHGVIEILAKNELLLTLMKITPLPDFDLERLLVQLRHLILKSVCATEQTLASLALLEATACQCFINEFIYPISNEEAQLLNELQSKMVKAASQGKAISAKQFLTFACYKRLNHRRWLDSVKDKAAVSSIAMYHLDHFETEQQLRHTIPTLREITEEVSLSVREQYEESPYPRWVQMDVPLQSMSLSELATHLNLKTKDEKTIMVKKPDILVAGCGTGQHSIFVSKRYTDCEVLAIDLSLSSLAYAKRKTAELAYNNINYMQADILDLESFDKKFDLIESIGVLHHMKNPLDGWAVLTNKLKLGGLMKIGLYSKIARENIQQIRDQISEQNIRNIRAEMLDFRQKILEENNIKFDQVISSSDFYNTSNFQDLIFHVQEHTFTVPEIEENLKSLGLHFCGFETNAMSLFEKKYPKFQDRFSLKKWTEFEFENPYFFSGMYQFWCQKI